MIDRITFLTLGQTPRVDLVPEIVGSLPRDVVVEEFGALDGLERPDIEALAPESDDHAFVTRLADGSEVLVGKRWLTRRLQDLLDDLGEDPERVVVLLCTGDFSTLRGHGLFLDARNIVDRGVEALGHGVRRMGVVLPIERQVDEHHFRASRARAVQPVVASPYRDDDFAAAGRSLSGCEMIVMHCMGFTTPQRATVAEHSGCPVLLPRRLVTAALTQLL